MPKYVQKKVTFDLEVEVHLECEKWEDWETKVSEVYINGVEVDLNVLPGELQMMIEEMTSEGLEGQL